MCIRDSCRKCGKIFNYVSGLPICPACRDEAEKKFQVVKKFIRENPRADIREVAAACEVETSQIQQWIREERLEFTEDSPIKLPCENCGAMILSLIHISAAICRTWTGAERPYGEWGFCNSYPQ